LTIFTALIVGSDFALAGVPNVKLVDTLVFVAAYMFGLPIGASVGILSELIWAYASPWGMPGYIAPFLVLGEVSYALAGSLAARLWAIEPGFRSGKSLAIGGLLSLCAFLWDLETNLGTALVAFWPSLTLANVLGTELFGIPFMFSHEVSDFMFGMLLVPVIIMMLPRLAKSQRLSLRPILAREKS
jgi:hypothetical protein